MKCSHIQKSSTTAKHFKVKDNTFIEKVDSAISLPEDFHWRLLAAYVDDLKGYLSDEDKTSLAQIIRQRNFVAYLGLSETWGLKIMNTHGEMCDFSQWKARYHIASLLKKLHIEDENFDKAGTALKKFLSAEKKCKFFNAFPQAIEKGTTEFHRDLLSYAKAFLRKLLTDKVPIKAVVENSCHGPGANLDTIEGYTDSYFKYRNIPYSCTRSAAGYAQFMIATNARWITVLKDDFAKRTGTCADDAPLEFWDNVIRYVDHNKVSFVPKNAETLRSIAIEPSLNVMLQLGVDKVIRNRLLSQFGIDLSDQQVNSRLARLASIAGNFATIDLSAASDSIAIKLVKLLLPTDWYDFLMALRSPKGLLKDGKILDYQKISSMGNGYTFVLESAIFASLIYAVCKMHRYKGVWGKNINVYGDDLIVPTELYAPLKEALSACGFSVNDEKSFYNGNVRESCGTDWWNGLPIRPVFLQQIPEDVTDLFVVINKMKRHLELSYGLEFSSCYDLLIKWVPRGTHAFGPYSDEVFDSWIHSKCKQYESFYNCLFHFTRLQKRCLALDWQAARSDFPFRKLKSSLRGAVETHQFNRRISTMGQFTIDSKEFVVERRFVVSSFWPTHYTLTA